MRRTALAVVCGCLGVGSGVALAACGEDRGGVDVEGATTGLTEGRTATGEGGRTDGGDVTEPTGTTAPRTSTEP